MAKRLVKVPLATKVRLLLGSAVLAILIVALIVPWYFMELLAQRDVKHWAGELTALRQAEWVRYHRQRDARAQDGESLLVALHSGRGAGYAGPLFVPLDAAGDSAPALDGPATQAVRAFRQNPSQELAVVEAEDPLGEPVYRCFRAVRAGRDCRECHGGGGEAPVEFAEGELVGVVDATVPAAATAEPLVWATRSAFIVGVVLAAVLAFLLLATITQRLMLRPLRHLHELTDRVAEGDLSSRAALQTHDEFQRLGESINEMLDAIADQHAKLRAANRALDLKLHELAEANVTLFRANRIKDDFLANVSHELRTPLNSILGFADLLADADDARVRRYGENIRAGARNLLAMINDLLDLAKIEAGKAEVRFDTVSLHDTCQTLTTLMQPLADKKQLTLRAALADDLPLIVTDAGKVQQILYNLLSNAVKFTPAGGQVTLEAGTEPAAGPAARPGVYVTVADTGPGLSEADQQHIFDKFHQLDTPMTKASSGTGLGLAIARELAGLLHGRLTLRSAPGQGARFTLHLPAEPPPEAPAPTRS